MESLLVVLGVIVAAAWLGAVTQRLMRLERILRDMQGEPRQDGWIDGAEMGSSQSPPPSPND
jgi:hypothetical protein